MKILFAYFDFTSNDNYIFSPHLHDECSLNFSTKDNFSVEKKTIKGNSGETRQYIISQEKKPEKDCLPDGFWGERIYNITAIVGDNGSGKSTILHSIIKSVIMGLNPHVPFLLILQESECERLYLYCSNETKFVWHGQGDYILHSHYPDMLKHAKCMLLDNTLSYSSFLLSEQYTPVAHRFAPANGIYFEWAKQFYNKSLFSSIKFSYDISITDEQTATPVSDIMSIHFTYESFQETRFLFDDFHQAILNELEKEGYPIPRSKHLTISVMSPNDMYADFFKQKLSIRQYLVPLFNAFPNQGIAGQMIINSIINLVCYLFTLTKDPMLITLHALEYEIKEHFFEKDLTTTNQIAEKAFQFINDLDTLLNNNTILLDSWRQFIKFMEQEEDNLSDVFQFINSSYQRYTQYVINVQETASNPQKQKLMITFLEKYRLICDPRYFLVFSSGLSSGEKNLLRMLTQFRYMLKGPSEESQGTYLQNSYGDDYLPCDTLFLFLDEVDLTYHPEWQRIIISMLTTILPRMFCNPYILNQKDMGGCCDIQIILATHSPLILGDFPKASVIYLKDQKKDYHIVQQSTFGENLYTILKDGFFMNDTIGEFAKRKINSVVEWCAAVRKCYRQKNKNDETLNKLCSEYILYYKSIRSLSNNKTRDKLILELHECAKILGISDTEKESDQIKTASETTLCLNDKDNDSISKSKKITTRNISKWCSSVKEYHKQKGENDKQKTELSDKFIKEYEIMQLLPSGIIQNKLILELQECARKLAIHYPDDNQDNPIMLKKTINELKAQLELERKHRKEGNTNEYNT